MKKFIFLLALGACYTGENTDETPPPVDTASVAEPAPEPAVTDSLVIMDDTIASDTIG